MLKFLFTFNSLNAQEISGELFGITHFLKFEYHGC